MCGLSFYYCADKRSDELTNSLDRISHRGPDGRGVREWKLPNGFTVGLGHVRLSVLDLSPAGAQPLVSKDGRIAMVFNGEIYNHHQLKHQLGDPDLSGHSDSEVLVEYFARYGVGGLASLRGMFAVAFLDIESGVVTVARDPMGIKPVYYYADDHGVFCSSEIRGLTPFVKKPWSVSRSALYEFLNCGFVYEPDTGIEGVKKVPPGSYLEIIESTLKVKPYFDLDKATRIANGRKVDVAVAVASQLESDVKLGVFYSGGTDSTVIAHYARVDNLFAGYDAAAIKGSGMVDDRPYAMDIAGTLGLNVIPFDMGDEAADADAIVTSMQSVAAGTEEMISDYTYMASLQLAQGARLNGYKVMLSGMGGDELFIGYPRYRILMNSRLLGIIARVMKVPFFRRLAAAIPRLAKKIERFLSFYSEPELTLAYSRLLGYLSRSEIRALWKGQDEQKLSERFSEKCTSYLRGFEGDSLLLKGLVLDYHGYLSHNLSVADKSSMRVGLEMRVPLLDQDMYCDHIASLRSSRGARSFGKKPLKEILHSILPRSLVERRKTGFNPPLDTKIETLGATRILKELDNSPIKLYLNSAVVESIVNDHFSRKSNNTYKIWQMLYLGYWLADKAAPAAAASLFNIDAAEEADAA